MSQKYRNGSDGIHQRIRSLPAPLLDKVVSVFVAGSFVRGDFNPLHSDLDFCVVRHDEATLSPAEVRQIGGCFDPLLPNPKLLRDYVGLRVADLPVTEDHVYSLAGCAGEAEPWPYLWVYGFDLAANHLHIFGHDVVARMPTVDPCLLIAYRVQRVDPLQRIEKAAGNRKTDLQNVFLVPRLTTHLMKWAQLYFGQPTIRKDEVLPLFMKHVPDFPSKPFARELWDEYLRHNLWSIHEAASAAQIADFGKKTLVFARQLAGVLKNTAARRRQ
jgi:hypothetical protein